MYVPLVAPVHHRYTHIWHCNRLRLVPIILCSFVRSFARLIHFHPVECDSIDENEGKREREIESKRRRRRKIELKSNCIVYLPTVFPYIHIISAFHQIQLPFGELKMFPFLLTFSHVSFLLLLRPVYLLLLFILFFSFFYRKSHFASFYVSLWSFHVHVK